MGDLGQSIEDRVRNQKVPLHGPMFRCGSHVLPICKFYFVCPGLRWNSVRNFIIKKQQQQKKTPKKAQFSIRKTRNLFIHTKTLQYISQTCKWRCVFCCFFLAYLMCFLFVRKSEHCKARDTRSLTEGAQWSSFSDQHISFICIFINLFADSCTLHPLVFRQNHVTCQYNIMANLVGDNILNWAFFSCIAFLQFVRNSRKLKGILSRESATTSIKQTRELPLVSWRIWKWQSPRYMKTRNKSVSQPRHCA